MTNFTDVGIDINNIGNIEPLNITFATTIEGILESIPQKANELTMNYFGLMSSVTMFFFLMYTLSDMTEFSDFRYSIVRSVGMASCIVSMLGIMFLAMGFFTSYYHIVVFIVITMICTMWVFKEE